MAFLLQLCKKAFDMRNLLKLPLWTMISMLFLSASTVQDFENDTFTTGETLTYKVKYDIYINIPVAELEIKVKEDLKDFRGQECLHFSANAKTYSFYDNFFKVRDYFNAYVDAKTFEPVVFTRNVSEGKYKRKDYSIFNPSENIVVNQDKKEFEIPEETRDILSVWYLARTFDYENMEIGDSVKLQAFFVKETFPVGLVYLGKETIKSKVGKIECYKIKPQLITGEVFVQESDMTLWVTADKNRVPVEIETGIKVGRVRIELTDYSGLKHDWKEKN